MSWFLTGEYRNYKADKGIFDILVPQKPFSLTTDGLGAWGARRALQRDRPERRRRLGRPRARLTAGLNRYPIPYIRFMASYIHVAEIDGGLHNLHDEEDLPGTRAGGERVDRRGTRPPAFPLIRVRGWCIIPASQGPQVELGQGESLADRCKRRQSEMPNRRIRPLHKAARWMGLVLGLLAQPGMGQGVAIEPNDEPQQQRDWGPITCVVSNDGYDVHFTAYARASPEDGMPGEAEPPVQFCQDLPATGPTHLTLDLMNREARTRPVALRVVREGDDDSDDDSKEASVPKSPLLEVPSKIYPTGVVEADVGLDEPGEYAVLVDFDKGTGHGQGQVRIPLRVGQAGGLPTMIIGPLIGVLLVAALVAAWLVYRRSGKIEI